VKIDESALFQVYPRFADERRGCVFPTT